MSRVMPRPLLVLLLLPPLLALAACGGDSGSGPSGEFTTLSYNVGGLPQEVSQINPQEHIPLISPLINGYDIVLTQEDWDWWIDDLDALDFANYHTRLRAMTDYPYQSEQHPGPEAVGLDIETERPLLMVGDGLGILSRFPFDEFRRVPWRSCGVAAADCLAMKGFGMARVTLAEGVTVDVYTLHAEAGGEADDNAAREEGFQDLAAYIAQNSAGNAIILGGDMNLHTDPSDTERPDRIEDARVWQEFLDATGLTDVCDALSCADSTRIDKFAFRSAEGLTLEPLSWEFEAERYTDARGEPLSDHDPLRVAWRWSAK